MNFWIEHDEDGYVLAAYSGQEDQPALMGGSVKPVLSPANPSITLWADGGLLDLGPAPSPAHIRDAITRSWVVPGMSMLQLAQAAKWEQIKAARATAAAANVVTPHGIFDADRQNIVDTIALLRALAERGLPAVTNFTLADNSVAELALEQMVDVGLALGVQVQAAFDTARDLRAQIYAAGATEASVAAVAWPTSETS